MIGFSIMMWFCSVIILILSVSLLRGNYAGIHGKVFDNTEDKEGYARALGKPALLLGLGMAVTGVLAVVIRGLYSVIISVIFLLVMVVISGVWFAKIQKILETFNWLWRNGNEKSYKADGSYVKRYL